MNYFRSLFILFAVLCVTSCKKSGMKEELSIQVEKSWYISSSTGDNSNAGTEYEPLKSISALSREQRQNAAIYLKRGDVFFENVQNFDNCVFDAYGEGPKPLISGFRVLRNPDAWVAAGPGLWKIDLRKDEDFLGFPSSLATNPKKFTDVGCMYDAANDSIYGHIVSSVDLLLAQGDVFTSDKWLDSEIDMETYRYFTLKRDANPSDLGNVCFSTFEYGFADLNHCIVKNIAAMGFARHGMRNIFQCYVENCDFDIIGGAIQTATENWVRYGNGIEFWIPVVPTGFTTVTGCTVSRTYDCGATIQGGYHDLIDACDIHFIGNKFIHCRQAFEHFLISTNTESNYIDCEFTGNLAYGMGDNGFSSFESRDANILSYEPCEKEIKITDNEFFGANYYCGSQLPVGMENNTVYLYQGQYIVHSRFGPALGTIYAVDENSIENYRKKYFDYSDIIIMQRGSQEAMDLERDFLIRIGYTVPDLKLDQLLSAN